MKPMFAGLTASASSQVAWAQTGDEKMRELLAAPFDPEAFNSGAPLTSRFAEA